jgi:hypothetical protein
MRDVRPYQVALTMCASTEMLWACGDWCSKQYAHFLTKFYAIIKKIRPKKCAVFLGLMPSGLVEATDVSEEYISCIFRVEE